MKKFYYIILILLSFSLLGCSSSNKNILKLNHHINMGLEEDDIINEKEVLIKVSGLEETSHKAYEEKEGLKPFTNYIKDTFNITLDNSWDVFIHYYDDEKTRGIIEFTYKIKDITTNKVIFFAFTNGVTESVIYKCLDYEVDENKLLERLENFKETYTQEKVKLEDSEEILSESTNYAYFYSSEKFIYSYAVSIRDKDGKINNSNATQYFIP